MRVSLESRRMATERITVNGDLSAEKLQKIIADNASYRTRRDMVMAANLIDAAEALLAIPLAEIDHSGERARVEVRVAQERLAEAIEWLELQRACSAPPRQYLPARDWRD